MYKKLLRLAVLSPIIVCVFGLTAHATSFGDSAWTQTSSLHVSAPTSASLSAVDVTTDYTSYITNSPFYSQDEKDWYTWCMGNVNAQWAVFQVNIGTDAPGRTDVVMDLSCSPYTQFAFSQSSGTSYVYGDFPSYSTHQYTLAYYYTGVGSQPAGVYAYQVNTTPQDIISTSGPASWVNNTSYSGFLINGTIIYPTNYAGLTIPSTYTPPATIQDPSFSLAVKGLDVTFHSTVDLAGVTACYWRFDTDPTTNDVAGEPSSTSLETLDCSDQTYHYTAFGDYWAIMFISNGTETRSTIVHLFKVDGSTYTDDVYVNGAGTQSIYEDCPVGDVPCYLRNFAKWIFTPDFTTLGVTIAMLQETVRTHLGFLWYPFDWLIATFTKAGLAVTACTVDTSGIPGVSSGATFFGHSFNFNLCQAQTDFPQIWNIAIFFIRALTVFGLIFGLYHRLEYLLMERGH